MAEELNGQIETEDVNQNAQVEGSEVTPDSSDGEQHQEVAPYTPEEVEEILKADGVLDRKRLTPEGRLIQKAFEKGTTPKFQAASQKMQEAERLYREAQFEKQMAMQRQSQPQPQDAKGQYFQRYMQNPLEVTNEINSAIGQLRASGEWDKISSLESLRDEFKIKREQEIDNQRNQDAIRQHLSTVQAQAEVEVLRDIPDFKERLPHLEAFAKESGLTDEFLKAVTNAPLMEVLMRQAGIQMSGVDAVKQFAKFINSQFERANPQRKQVKTAPKALARSGSGATGKAGVNKAALFEKAKQTGDWTEYLAAKGALHL